MFAEMLESRPSAIPIVVSVACVLFAIAIVRFLRYRLAFHKLHESLKAPPFNTVLGTIPALAGMFKISPEDTHPGITLTLLWRKYGLGDLYFLDNWPAAPERQMIINDPALAAQVVQTKSLPKHPLYPKFAAHICGKTSMIWSEGALWKRTRSLFNPGFAASHLMNLVPTIVDDTMVFWQNLDKIAKSKEIVQLEHISSHLTIDIMGHVILDHDLNSQTGQNRLVEGFKNAISWTPSAKTINPFAGLNPVRPFAHWYWTRVMDTYLAKLIKERYQKLKDGSIDQNQKCAIDLALIEYDEQQGGVNDSKAQEIDKTTLQIIIDGMKTFLFAGHDTSSSTICYVYHMLELNPKCLTKIIEEHNEVFGEDTSMAADAIKKNPPLLNKLPYTLAVIKETLRLFSVAITTRIGSPSVNLTTPDGKSYSTAEHMIWVNVYTIHRRADLFPEPESFIPERFLEQDIPKDAWRPFEKGPRSCIGQELALLEMKAILALTVRDFEIKAAYEEWDRMKGREKPGEILGGRRGVFGYRAYQVLQASSKPSDDMPARVTRRSAASV